MLTREKLYWPEQRRRIIFAFLSQELIKKSWKKLAEEQPREFQDCLNLVQENIKLISNLSPKEVSCDFLLWIGAIR